MMKGQVKGMLSAVLSVACQADGLTQEVPEATMSPWPERIPGLCDISGAVVGGDDTLLLGTDEQDNTLYRLTLNRLTLNSAAVNATAELNALFALAGTPLLDRDDGVPRELDIEGATTLTSGDSTTAFWIGSHAGRKVKARKDKPRKAKARVNRQFLFATTIPDPGRDLSLVGTPFAGLRAALASAPSPIAETLKPLLNIEKGADYPNAGGWNIEGLASTVDGHLLFGFRSPVGPLTGNKALVVRLDNPFDVLQDKPAVIGAAEWLDLGTRGIRSMAWSPQQQALLILAGPVDFQDPSLAPVLGSDEYPQLSGYATDFALFRWGGFQGALDQLPVDVSTDLRPEAMIPTPTGVYLISDDGDVMRAGETCKDRLHSGPSEQTYARARHVTLQAPRP
jgi:hypothetical protein